MGDQITNFRVLKTIFLVRQDGQLKHHLNVQVDNSGATARGHLQVQMAGKRLEFDLPAIAPGRGVYPINVPEVTQTTAARFVLKIGDQEHIQEVSLEPVRHWKVYLVHFSHHDLGYTDLPEVCIDQHKTYFDRIVDYCHQTDDLPEEARFRWTCDTTWAIKYYLNDRPPEVARRFFELVRDGRIEITAQYAAFNSALLNHEELARSLYYAFALAKRYGFEITSAMTTDIPGAPWGFPQVLARSGVRYLATAVNQQYAQSGRPRAKVPNICRPFYWGSPDGSEVLVWNSDPQQIYFEGLSLGLTRDYEQVHRLLPAYLAGLEANGYAFDAIQLRTTFKGCDNAPPCPYLPRIVYEWDRQWAYPQLIMATSTQFFRYMEECHASEFPHYNGDWTDWWSDGPASSAQETGLNRNTHEELASAEKLAAVRSVLDGGFAYPATEIEQAYDNMMLYDEHTWGMWSTCSDPHAPSTAQHWRFKADFAYQAAKAAGRLLQDGLGGLGRLIKAGSEPAIAIFNPLSWQRTAPVQVALLDGVVGAEEPFSIVADDGRPVPYRIVESHRQGSLTIAFLAEDVPSIGYRTYRIVRGSAPERDAGLAQVDGNRIENAYYRVTLDPRTGGIASIRDKELGVELVDADSAFRLNEYVYDSGEPPVNGRFFPEQANILAGANGPVWSSLVAMTKCRTANDVRPADPRVESRLSTYATPWIKQEVILYDHLKRIDIVNRLFKEETLDKEGVYYAFPFLVPGGRFRVEVAGASMTPGLNQLPDSCHDWHSTGNWLDLSNTNYGVTWSSREVPVVSIGDINTGKWQSSLDTQSGTFFAYLMNNYWDVNFKERQGGDFTFRFSLTSHGPDWDNARAARFGWGYCTELLPVMLSAGPPAPLPEGRHSFCQLDSPGIMALTCKRAEDGDGLILRLLEVLGKETPLRLRLTAGKIAGAYRTDIVERDAEPLPVERDEVVLTVPAYGLETVRVRVASAR